MATEHYKGLLLNEVPTGFGTYTGVVLKNQSPNAILYSIEAQPTTLYKNIDSQAVQPVEGYQELIPDTDALDLNLSNNTIKVSPDLQTFADSAFLELEGGSSGIFYISHKPFSTFAPQSESVGFEQANINIFSTSSNGSTDEVIVLDVTGQRILDPPDPSKLMKFICTKRYNEEYGYYLDAIWSIGKGENFLTGFILDVYTDKNDPENSHVQGSPFDIGIEKNVSSDSLPDYLSYYNENTKNYLKEVTSVSLSDSELYARIRGVNGLGEEGLNVFAKGVDYGQSLQFTDEILYAKLTEPDNLAAEDALELDIEKRILSEENIDLSELIYTANNNSYDLSRFSSVNIKLIGSTSDSSVSSFSELPPIFLKNKNFKFQKSLVPNKFTITIQIKDLLIRGRDGEGSKFISNEERIPAEDGGSLFELDNINYNGIQVEYQILKDRNSKLIAGLGGARSYQADSTSDENEVSTINYSAGKTLYFNTDFVHATFLQENLRPDSAKNLSERGRDGSFLKASPNNLSNVYLKFSGTADYRPPSGLNFRFSSRATVNSNAGATTSEWGLYSGTKTGFVFKSVDADDNIIANGNFLKVCEAYGKKFYELYTPSGFTSSFNSAIQIFNDAETHSGNPNKFPVFYGSQAGQTDIDPNYTILVFALGKKSIPVNSTYAKESQSMMNRMSNMHRFIDRTSWNFAEIDGNASINPYAWTDSFYSYTNRSGQVENKASFVGSPLNSMSYIRANYVYQEVDGELIQRNSPRQQYKYSAKQQIPIGIRSDDYKRLWANTFVYDTGGFLGGYHAPFLPKNSALTQNLNNNDTKFRLNDGSDLELDIFNLYFVLMKSNLEFIDVGVPYVQQITDGNQTSNQPIEVKLVNQTSINGENVFMHQNFSNFDFTPRHNLIRLSNSSGQDSSDERPRLYLMEYMQGKARTPEERNDIASQVMDSLVKEYESLILKSSNMHVVDSSGNQQLSFGLPTSSNYSTIYTG